ncbi:probable E3 ubiquitin-protein ligase TRIML1 [Antechinus flavipes]|uniref:probable E3 ubiquitin-protein ligase TRIML1 n=1 Tax=Antechinus flavipes TaxID=38775 RepID=UPI0022366628|nr:probable E3 ubiquitin-protein ligase TRIML1 [Antechinus flavipes]
MDIKSLIKNLNIELTCSICLDYFTDPVIANCSHSFCRECLLQCMWGAGDTLTCPECRQLIQISNLVPNPNLQKLSTAGKTIGPHLLQSMVALATCDQHWEKAKFFCEEDRKLLCDSCSITQEHRDHRILPLDNAIAEGKEKLQETSNMLQKKQEKFKIAFRCMRNRKIYFREIAYAFKESIINENEKMHQFLWDEEALYLQILDEESKDNLEEIEEKKTKLTQQIQNLQQMILEIEKRLDKNPLEMLQDMKNTLARNEELLSQKLEVSYPIWSICYITGLQEMLISFQRNITLDPDTANPHLILNEELNSIKYTSVPKDLPDNEERFDCCLTVLGTQTFTSGKHYWEVNVGDKTEWIVGICENSISRKETHSLSSKDVRTLMGFTSEKDFFLWNSQCGFYESEPIHVVGIFIDYEKGHIAFYNSIDGSLICSPPNIAFQGPIRPYFSSCYPNENSNSGSIIICSGSKSANDVNYYGNALNDK